MRKHQIEQNNTKLENIYFLKPLPDLSNPVPGSIEPVNHDELSLFFRTLQKWLRSFSNPLEVTAKLFNPFKTIAKLFDPFRSDCEAVSRSQDSS